MYPGVWRHGDYFVFNFRGGCYVRGRSDATLNRYGVRMGTAEIYRTIEGLEEIADSLIVNLDLPGGDFFMPLFVKLKDGYALDETVSEKIRSALRSYSPRHVPDEIREVELIPYTRTEKKMEVPVRRILMGQSVDEGGYGDSVAIPEALDFYIEYARYKTISLFS